MTGSPDIIIVGEVYFPERTASAFSLLGKAKALREAGFSVLFAGMEKDPRPEDRQSDGTYAYHGFPYVSERGFGDGRIARLKRGLFTHVTGGTTIQRLHEIDTRSTQAILTYQCSSVLLWRLRRFCRKRRIALIAYRTEWFDAKHMPWGRCGVAYWDAELCARRILPKIGHVTCISSYLHRYYQSRGCHAMWVPTLIDLDACNAASPAGPTASHQPADELRLVFSGSPPREQWDVIFAGLKQMRQAGRNVRLDVYGSSRESFLSAIGAGRKLAEEFGDALVVHGRVSREEYLRGVLQADFIVMLREIARWSQACLPTKLPELMAMGMPIITNAHSDLGEFIRDGVEGLIVEQPAVPEFVATLTRAMRMRREDIVRLGENSRQRAEERFNYRRYAGPLGQFFREAIAAVPSRGDSRADTLRAREGQPS
jgi:glycosyltransferase involved in cell wall biosynthesis